MSASFIPASINGVRVYVTPETLEDGGSGPLTPSEHIVDGELSTACLNSDTYAHCTAGGLVRRYGQTIGTREDIQLETVDAEARGELGEREPTT